MKNESATEALDSLSKSKKFPGKELKIDNLINKVAASFAFMEKLSIKNIQKDNKVSPESNFLKSVNVDDKDKPKPHMSKTLENGNSK